VNRRFLIKGLVIGLAVLGAAVLAYCGIVRYVKMKYAEFSEVVPGVLYRCGRMNPEIVEDGVRKYGVRTIVDLRGDESAPKGAESEPDWARRNGLSYFNLRVNTSSGDEMVANFLVIATTPERRPVLVHCHHGRSRTNLCVAMYRMTQQGWSVEKAFDEMVAFGLFSNEKDSYRKFLRDHEKFDWKKCVTVDPHKPGTVENLRIR
jgi:protein tyrosine/serine phosphatase